MAQSSDQTVQNASFPSVRADINDNLAALFSSNSGNSAPTSSVEFQLWVSTSVDPPTLNIKRGSIWVTIGTIGTTASSFAVGGTTAIANGGTGETTAAAALTALLPSQTGNADKALFTNGTIASWGVIPPGSTVEVFTANNTWTKPGVGTIAYVELWGGGGGGARSSTAGGGGGGAYAFYFARLSDLPSTVSVFVGAGGAGKTGSNGNGANGGMSSFGVFTAGGGGGGITGSTGFGGGGGGGWRTSGAAGTPGDGWPDGGISAVGMSGQDPVSASLMGGAGGGPVGHAGGNSIYGGAGGGSRSSGNVQPGGTSTYGGNGGAGGGASPATGSVGGDRGGGGGGAGGAGGDGGRGEVRVYVW